ncbi:TrmH family RNA methyltransferase [Microbacterium aquilitoris]|uniref:TrmH family RNA methyltransferase n=1 Tax=Microbacterium aquilitoris TaxID=3067307 RepID=UPI0028926BA3|nr:TrmH family RNA methyltransferase [Microbacterium sp. KSW2-22]MDT3343699.1 TrmH family RNA methyltransferase [Microbacterium sp. KSW2-22]
MTTIRIDDPSDPRLSDYRGLTDTALRRIAEPEGGLYIAESAKVISRAVGAGHRPRSVLVQEKWIDDVAVLAGDAPVYVVPDTVAEQVTGFAVHRGALAAMHRPVQPDPAQLLEHSRTVVVLEDIVDHTNVGAAFRAAAALGADAVLVSPRCGDPLYRRSVRVSMGTVFQVPWARLPEWDAAAPLFAAAGVHLAAMALADDAVPLDDFAAARPDRLAILMGAEGEGLSASALAVSDSIVTIPMAGGVDSLNVASAAAVALWALR